MKTIFFLFLLPLCFARPQEKTSLPQEVVNLLMQNDFRNAEHFFESLESDEKKELYDKIAVVDSMNVLSCEEMCSSFKMQRVRYDSTDVPGPIVEIYESASLLVDKDELRQALKVYFIAFALRKDFVERERTRLMYNFNRTKELLRGGNNDSVLFYIRLDEKENTESMAYSTLNKQYDLRRFYQETNLSLKKEEEIQQYELGHSETFDPAVIVYMGYNVCRVAGRKSPPIRRMDVINTSNNIISPYILDSGQQPSEIYLPNLGFIARLGEQTSLSFDFSTFLYSIQRLIKPVMYYEEDIYYRSDDLRIRTYQVKVSFHYVFRPRIGLRPFMEVGGGMNFNSSEEKELLGMYGYKYYSTEQKNTSYLLSTNLGLEYVLSKEDMLYGGVKFGFDWFVNSTNLTGTTAAKANLFVNISIL